MIDKATINWLLESDPSIQYQVYRDLLNKEKKQIQNQISREGWGNKLLSMQNSNGHWGIAFYQPKWTSTHYTLLDLRNLNISPRIISIRKINSAILQKEMLHGYTKKFEMIVNNDVCINGMVLNYSSYFTADEILLQPIVDYIIKNKMPDGGFNCQSTRSGASHSSLHTTISVLEGLYEFRKNGYEYREKEIIAIEKECIEFILKHKLYKSDKTGKIIHPNFTKLSFPSRWKFDILRCLDFFQYAHVKFDNRMDDAIEILISKRKKNNRWTVQAKHPGQTHFDMENAGQPSRWNTLRALRVLKYFNRI